MSDADFCQVTVAMGMWPLSYYFTQVETATGKSICDAAFCRITAATAIRPFVHLLWIGIVFK